MNLPSQNEEQRWRNLNLLLQKYNLANLFGVDNTFCFVPAYSKEILCIAGPADALSIHRKRKYARKRNSGLTWERLEMDLCTCACKQDKLQVKQKAEQKRKRKKCSHATFNPSFSQLHWAVTLRSPTHSSKGTSLLLFPTYATLTNLIFASTLEKLGDSPSAYMHAWEYF